MKKTNDIIVRAFKTFLQAFTAYVTISLASTDFSEPQALKALVFGALASGISAVMNLVISFIEKKKEVK